MGPPILGNRVGFEGGGSSCHVSKTTAIIVVDHHGHEGGRIVKWKRGEGSVKSRKDGVVINIIVMKMKVMRLKLRLVAFEYISLSF